MHILHINFSDRHQGGGGAIAMYRLHQGLIDLGVESHILCHRKTLPGSESTLHPAPTRRDRLAQRLTQRLGLNDIHNLSTFKIQDLPAYQWADVLNLHIIHSNYFNYLALPELTRTKPAVFTLHDMWAFTGHCVYSFGCDRWKIGCGHCPDLNLPLQIRRDASAWDWKLKRWAYKQSHLAIVCPSQWLTDLARQSLLKGLPISPIANGLDLTVYRPLDSAACRRFLGLPGDRPILLYVAANPADYRKGFDLWIQAIQRLPPAVKSDLLLLVMGSRSAEEQLQALEIEVVHLGYVEYEPLKVMVYSAADLFVFPTRADNLPLVIQESLACGTPVVSFRVGGVPDMVKSGQTGYLAEPENVEDLANGIAQLLEDSTLRQQLSRQSRQWSEAEYALPLQAQRYHALYQNLLAGHSSHLNNHEVSP